MWIRRTIVIAAVLVTAATSAGGVAATPTVIWHREPAFSVEGAATDGLGHVYVTGFAPRGTPRYFGKPYAMILAKFDDDGARVWTRTWRSGVEHFPHAMGFDVAVSPDGRDVYVVGGLLMDAGEAGKARVWAFTASGRLRWSQASPDVGWWMTADAGADGLVAGAASIASWTRGGDLRWMRPFLDRTGDLCFRSDGVSIGSGGAIYAAGLLDEDPTCNDSEGGNLQDADIVIQKRAASGPVMWTRVAKDPGERDNDRLYAVEVVGSRVFAAGVDDGRVWFARLTTDGRIVWTRRWAGDGVDLSVSPWGPVEVLANRPGATVLRGYTPAGGDLRTVWKRPLGEAGSATAVATGSGHGLFVTARAGDTGDLWRLRP